MAMSAQTKVGTLSGCSNPAGWSVFSLVPLTCCACLNEVLRSLAHMGDVEVGPEMVERLGHTLMSHLVGVSQDGRHAWGQVIHKDAARHHD
jgi:hypothetical protein